MAEAPRRMELPLPEAGKAVEGGPLTHRGDMQFSLAVLSLRSPGIIQVKVVRMLPGTGIYAQARGPGRLLDSKR